MQIDWFTFVAQIINFGILLWLLNRFLYVPITTAIADRETAISDRIAAADSQFAEATRLQSEMQTRRDQIDSETDSIRAAARAAIEQERGELFNAARQSVEQQRTTWLAEFERETHTLNQSVKTSAAETAVEIARRALSDLADADLDEQIVEKFIDRVSETDLGTLESITQSLCSNDSITITTGHEPGPSHRTAIESALRAALAKDLVVDYQTNPDLVAGIQLTIGSHEISWCLNGYLEAVAEQFEKAVALGDSA